MPISLYTSVVRHVELKRRRTATVLAIHNKLQTHTKLKRTLIQYARTQEANLRGNPFYQGTKQH